MDSQTPSAPELPNKVPQLVKDGKRPEPDDLETPNENPELAGMPPDEEDDTPDTLNEHVENPGDPDGVVAEEEARKWREEYPALKVQEKPKRRWLIVLLVLLLAAGAAFAAYKFGLKKAAPTPVKKATTTNAQPSTTTKKQTEETATVVTKHYDSTTYTLSFDYPETWTVSDTATKLTVTSPSVQLKGTSGTASSVHVVLTIQNPQTTIAGYPSGGATAALTSDKLTYKQPTSVQRAQTYLSYLGYKSSGLDALYVTGDNGYQQGQNVPMSDVVKGNPLISVTFETCSTIDCTHGTTTAATVSADDWKTSATAKQVVALIQSIQLN